MNVRLLRAKAYVTAALMGLALLTGGCSGFQMRGAHLSFPFETIAIDGNQPVANDVRQFLGEHPKLKIISKTIEARAVLVIISQYTERVIVAFNAAGRPREIQLRMRVSFKVNDGYAVEITPPQEITAIRDITINEAEVLATNRQETIMIDDMQRDIARQLVRRLRAVKLPS